MNGRSAHSISRYTEIGTLSVTIRAAVRRMVLPLCAVCIAASAYIEYGGRPGAWAFVLMSAGTCAALLVWSGSAAGLPLLPLFVAQNLVIYGVPVLMGHETDLEYPQGYLLKAGAEVLILNLSIAASWRLAMRMLHLSPPSSLAFHDVNREGIRGWRKMGFSMISAATAFQVLLGLHLIDGLYALLPSGMDSLINTLLSVVSACGFFLLAMVLGGGQLGRMEKLAFWGLLGVNTFISASAFLLAGAAAYLFSVAVGIFWSSGKVPWRYLAVCMGALTFLNVGKATMRERYWGTEEARNADIPIGQMPACYSEWATVSLNAILGNEKASGAAQPDSGSAPKKNQTLLDRIDNMQNLLFVIEAMDKGHVSPLEGKTYTLIPPLLVPRILWPDKPRSHEGQVLLNVHFGRQDLNSTYTTYIAWGLLPEAYGNFGPVAGALALGAFLGAFFAWVEKRTARKLLVSTEGLLSLSLLMNLLNSFEMVASVLVTSTFQSMMVILIASAPFVRRTRNPTPDEH
jgi:hypothetical protein